jgi:hypothetical protein
MYLYHFLELWAASLESSAASDLLTKVVYQSELTSYRTARILSYTMSTLII